MIYLFASCSTFHQPGTITNPSYTKIYLTDYNTVWQSTLDALKRFERTVVNRQGGIIQTAWIDNTAEKNFTDTFGESPIYLKAKYRLTLSVAPGTFKGKPSVKMTIQKEQLIQRDMLEGWTEVTTDSIDENTILYRIGRLVYTKLKLKAIEEQKTKQILEEGV